ncbi:hypothetical protein B296_00019904 [Ensete ventricosum]|uniref:Uncharacterized protein n=1 Tax=Ensete ventricosum TaxID=4639 RepID=A0A426YV94_ENSVE|nr:hypothetical protein B296_00019904 [Ensete ventricosum]
MNHYGVQQNAFVACEEMRVPFAFVDQKAPIFCPRPRQFSPLAAVTDPLRPVRWQSSHQSDFSDSIAGADRSFTRGIRLRLPQMWRGWWHVVDSSVVEEKAVRSLGRLSPSGARGCELDLDLFLLGSNGEEDPRRGRLLLPPGFPVAAVGSHYCPD